MKPVIAVFVVCALASACTVRSHTTVERPAPASTAVVVPAPATTTTTVVVPSN
jgi:hypothetical protein